MIVKHNFLGKPTQMVAIYTIYVFILKDIGDSMSVPEIDVLVITIGDIGGRQSFSVKQCLFHEPDPLRLG
jgi:hypothetical protein